MKFLSKRQLVNGMNKFQNKCHSVNTINSSFERRKSYDERTGKKKLTHLDQSYNLKKLLLYNSTNYIKTNLL